MGVDCTVHLPDNVRIDNVLKVLSKLAGNPGELKSFRDHKGQYADVSGYKTDNSVGSPGFTSVIVDHNGGGRLCFYSFEPEKGGRMFMATASAFWQAVAIGLAKFFGGKVDLSDCDDEDVDMQFPDEGREKNSPTDGEPWQNLQERIVAVQPISLYDMMFRTFQKTNVYGVDDGYTYGFDKHWRLTSVDPAFVGSIPQAVNRAAADIEEQTAELAKQKAQLGNLPVLGDLVVQVVVQPEPKKAAKKPKLVELESSFRSTSLRGYFHGPHQTAAMDKLIGKHFRSKDRGDKTKVEWSFEIEGQPFHIYDYKGCRNPWNVGATKVEDLEILRRAFPDVKIEAA